VNFKILGKYIEILGIAILAFGGIKFITNMPRESAPSAWAIHIFDEINRASNRESAKVEIIAGAIILFLGIAISSSQNTLEYAGKHKMLNTNWLTRIQKSYPTKRLLRS
jgi:hypothetical protein